MDTTKNQCGRAKWAFLIKSPVCDKPAGHEGRHHFDEKGAWGERDDHGRYIVPATK